MIGSLRGSLLLRDLDGWVLIEVAGVGYRVTIGSATMSRLGEIGAEVFLHVHHVVREDSETLYGFLQADDRRCFETLMGAHGVGPSVALAILNQFEPAELAAAVHDDDVAALCLVPGVGKKTAARLLIELKSKLDVGEYTPSGTAVSSNGAARGVLAEVREALSALGFGAEEIRDVMRDLPDGDDRGELVRQALQRLGRN